MEYSNHEKTTYDFMELMNCFKKQKINAFFENACLSICPLVGF